MKILVLKDGGVDLRPVHAMYVELKAAPGPQTVRQIVGEKAIEKGLATEYSPPAKSKRHSEDD